MSVKSIKMESKDKLKGIDIKNCVCYYFDDIIRDIYIFTLVIFY